VESYGVEMKPPKNIKYSDDFQTPPNTLEPLYPFLEPYKTIWEPAAGECNLVRALENHLHDVIATDIQYDESIDFLADDYFIEGYDAIVTNPPYSLKNNFLAKCYEIGKPFALLLPLTALESWERQKYYVKYGLELILFDKRINFITPSKGKSASWFASGWFTWGLNIGKQLTFAKLLDTTILKEKE